jgi:hypothetical protein
LLELLIIVLTRFLFNNDQNKNLFINLPYDHRNDLIQIKHDNIYNKYKLSYQNYSIDLEIEFNKI